MPKLNPFAVSAVALTLAIGGIVPTAASAQTAPTQTAPARPQLDANGRPIATEGSSRFRSRGGSRNRTPRVTPPAELIAEAQTLATAAGVSCQVSEAVLLGKNAQDQSAYEAGCVEGPGFILVGATPPQANSCIELASAVRTARERDPAAAVGIECKIPRNAAVLPFIAAYATEAGVPCTIDDGIAVGKAQNGTLIFEVGCAGQDGFRIDQSSGTWASQGCLEVVSVAGATCRFTTPDEQSATLKTWLASSEAASCDIQQARYMGRNASGTFYEAKCAAGDGYVARLDAAKAVQQIYPCASATQIGGGCTLTASAAAAPVASGATPATPQ